MWRVVYSVLVVVLASLILSVVPVQAQSQLADIRAQFNGLLIQLRTIDNTCVVILGGLINELDKDILHARKLITTGKGNLNRLLIDTLRSARNKAEILFDFLDQCGRLFIGFTLNFQEIVKELGPLLGVPVNGGSEHDQAVLRAAQAIELCTSVESNKKITVAPAALSTTIDLRKACRIIQLSAEVFVRATLMLSGLGFTTGLTTNAAVISNAVLSDLEEIFETGSCVVDEAALIQPMLTEKGPICFEQLRNFKVRLGQAHEQLRLALQVGSREFVRNKKWVLKAIREIKELLRASNFGGRTARELLNLNESTTRIYTLNGQLISLLTENSLKTQYLPNGVYLLIQEVKDLSGQIHRHVNKLVVAR